MPTDYIYSNTTLDHAATSCPSPSEPSHGRVSACHRALRCTEILDQVLQEFYSWTLPERYRSSHHVALVCHAFFHSAAAVTWHDIPSLEPLYSLLMAGAIHPEPNIVSVSVSVIVRLVNWSVRYTDTTSVHGQFDPPQAAWARFLRYTSLIRIVRKVELRELDSDRFRVLVRCNGGRTILPSARAFSIGGRTSDVGPTRSPFSTLALIASPVVSTLNVALNIDIPLSDLFRLSGAVAEVFPSLKGVTLPLSALLQSRKTIPVFIAGLVALPQLKSLELTVPEILNSFQLEATLVDRLICALPLLDHLHIGNPSVHSLLPQLDRWQGATAYPLAPRLRHLVYAGTWDAVASLPSALTCPCLEELRFSMRQRFSPDHAQDCVTVLSGCVRDIAEARFAPYLRTLSVNARYSVSGGIERPVLPPMADLLGPLFALERLETLCFKLHGWPIPSLPAEYSADDDMHAVAAGLPRIHDLELRHHRHVSGPLSFATLHSLSHFATLCPHLVSLDLAVLTDGDIPSYTLPTPWHPGDSIVRRLVLAPGTAAEVGQCLSLSESHSLAAFLHHLFPRLDILECSFRSFKEDAVVRDKLYVLRSSEACIRTRLDS